MARIEDPEKFFAAILRPPHQARMIEHAGQFVKWLGRQDKEMLLADAQVRFWETREQIKETGDILKLWIKALEFAARRRPKWQTWDSWGHMRWIKGTRLGRD